MCGAEGKAGVTSLVVRGRARAHQMCRWGRDGEEEGAGASFRRGCVHSMAPPAVPSNMSLVLGPWDRSQQSFWLKFDAPLNMLLEGGRWGGEGA